MALLVFVFFSLSLADKSSASGPRIFLPQTEWDFGYIPQGSSVSHIFWIKNTGDDTLQILKVRSGCTCTYAPLNKDILAPQESTYLEAIFNSRNYEGLKNMTIAIFSTDTSTISDVYFSVNVENEIPLVQINPHQIKFDSSEIGENPQRKAVITNKSNTVLHIAIAEEPEEIVDYKLVHKDLSPKEEAELIFSIAPKGSPGSFQTNLTLDFFEGSPGQGEKKLRYTLPISGTIVSK